MTHDELEGHIEQLLPSLRRKCQYTQAFDGLDDLQLAVIQVYNKADRLELVTQDDVKQTVLKFFHRLRYQRRIDDYHHQKRFPIERVPSDSNFDNPRKLSDNPEYEALHVNPWNTTQIKALEYLELVTDKRIKGLMFKYYILGYTLAELKTEHTITLQRIHQLIQQGIEQIRHTMR